MTVDDNFMPDDLIRQKAWTTLSAVEKEWLQDIAGSEAEYNLLRQMLLSAAAEPAAIPGPGEQVKTHLQQVFAANRKRKGLVVMWRYAAAAAVLAAIVGYAVIQLRSGTGTDAPLAANTPHDQGKTAATTEKLPAAPASATPETTLPPSTANTTTKPAIADTPNTGGQSQPVKAVLADLQATGSAAADATEDMNLSKELMQPAAPVVSSRVKDHEGLISLVSAVY